MSRHDDPLVPRPSRDEIEEEITHHLEGRIRELMDDGLDRAAAEREARRRFGSRARARRDVERIYRPSRMASIREIASEAMGALRALRRRPAFTLTAILLIAIGIGVTTAMLSILDAYLLREMPYPAAERLLRVRQVPPESRERTGPPPPVDWTELDEVELAVSWDLDAFTLVGDGRPEQILGTWVRPDYFEAFGIRPALGRVFTVDEAAEQRPVAVISHELWQTRFAGAPDVIGSSFRMYASDRPEDASELTVIGVLPADLWTFNAYAQVMAPLPGERTAYLVRLAEGASREEASAAMNALGDERWGPELRDWDVLLEDMHDLHVEGVRPVLGALAATVSLVLLIACANVAMLLVVQASGRTREFALRAALGAGRGRLTLRLLTEALWLAFAGAALGWAVADGGLRTFGTAIETQLGTRVPGGAVGLALDPRIALMSLGVTVVVAVLFGLAPLTAGLGRDPARQLTAGRTSTRTGRQRLLRTGLIVVELALSLALLAGAALTLRSSLHLANVDPGFRAEGLLRAELGLSSLRYPGPDDWHRRVDETLAALEGAPGVERAAAAIPPPLTSVNPVAVEALDGAAEPTPAAVRRITAGYFDTVGVPLISGRTFGPQDEPEGEPVAIVSTQLADRLWPGENPLGRSLGAPVAMALNAEPVWHRVVGVVGETREGLTDEREAPDVYVSLDQSPSRYVYLLVRTGQPRALLVPTLEEIVWSRDPEQPLTGPVMMRELMFRQGATPRALARLLGGFALFGVVLAVVGVYGVITFAARQRRRELAVRVALGAARSDVRALVLRDGARIVAVGLLCGLAAAWLTARSLASQIHGIRADDPLTLGGVAVLLGTVALVGVLLPARRAARTDPVELLREE